jgi:hypothetical protein
VVEQQGHRPFRRRRRRLSSRAEHAL